MPLPISPSVTSVVSCTVSEILQVLVLVTNPHSTLVLGVFSFEQIAHVGVDLSRYLELSDSEIIFEVFQPM